MLPLLKKAAKAAGGATALAKRLGTTRQNLHQLKRYPPHYITELVELTGIPAHEWRPDVFPAPVKRRNGVRVAA